MNQFVDGITNLAVTHARVNALSRAVHQANPLVKSLAEEFGAVFGDETTCTPDKVLAGTAPDWCLVFDGERTLIVQEYGTLAEHRAPFAGEIRKVDVDAMREQFRTVLQNGRRAGNLQPAADAYIDVLGQIRANTDRGGSVPSLSSYEYLARAARNAARAGDAGRLSDLYDNGLKLLRLVARPNFDSANDALRSRLDADLKGYKSALTAGTDFAAAAKDFAAAHKRLLNVIDDAVPPDTAILDR